jgi:hypothetical protein
MKALADIAKAMVNERGETIEDVIKSAAEQVLSTDAGALLLGALFQLVKPVQNPFIVGGMDPIEAAAQARLSELVMLLYANAPREIR